MRATKIEVKDFLFMLTSGFPSFFSYHNSFGNVLASCISNMPGLLLFSSFLLNFPETIQV